MSTDTKRHSITFYQEDKTQFDDLKDLLGGANQQDVIRYLLSLQDSKFERGSGMVERKLKQWLYLGFPFEITPHALRKAEYKETAHTGKGLVGLKTVKDVCDSYADEIEAHNKKIEKSQKKS